MVLSWYLRSSTVPISSSIVRIDTNQRAERLHITADEAGIGIGVVAVEVDRVASSSGGRVVGLV